MFLVAGCDSNKGYVAGRAYYFRSDIANYQSNRPNGEISKEEVEEYKRDGYAYYVVYFNDDQLPTSIEKHFQGKIVRKTDLFYQAKKLVKEVVTNESGKKTMTNHMTK